jgi:hypothetical protein
MIDAHSKSQTKLATDAESAVLNWETIAHPGYFGKRRDELYAKWNKTYGLHNWRIAYEWQGEIINREFAISLYEDGYYEYLKNNNECLEWLIRTASDVYDTAPTNVLARFSYDVQETPSNHIHDVAIRRSVYRLGEKFCGDALLEVRGKNSVGALLSPGVVPFHLPNLICDKPLEEYVNSRMWWKEKTIEDFYQKNKVLQIKV